MSFHDAAAGTYRAAVLQDGRLEAVLFVAASPKLPSPDWLKSRFELAAIPASERRDLLAGSPVEGAVDDGPMVCVCFQVGAKRIEAAAAAGHVPGAPASVAPASARTSGPTRAPAASVGP